MGVTWTGAQKFFGKNKKLLLFISSTSILHLIQPLTATLHQHNALI